MLNLVWWATNTMNLRDPRRSLPGLQGLQDIIAILGMDELSEDDKLTVARSKVPEIYVAAVHCCEVFTGTKGKFVSLPDTIKGFSEILSGAHDASEGRST